MKTIFITSFHAHISRNILATDVMRILRKAGARIVLVVPDFKMGYFEEKFGGENVIIEGANQYESSKGSRRGLIFKRLETTLFDSDTRRIKKRYKYYHDKKTIHFITGMVLGKLSNAPFIPRMVRALDIRLTPPTSFTELIDTYKPDTVFSTDVYNENDVSLMQAARRKRIPIIGMFRSWDNPTQRMMRIVPDRLLVGSEEIKKETQHFHHYPERQITIVGNPHYDRYLRGPTKSKKEFYQQFGLHPNKKLIFFAPLGDKFIKNNDIDQCVMELLGSVSAQVLVRFPPDEALTIHDFSLPSNMTIDRPGVGFEGGAITDREIPRQHDDNLINSIYYSDVVISGPTSILLDGAFFDKPVIAVHICPTKRRFFDTVYCYKFNHVQKLLKTNGVRYVTTKEELFRTISEYLENPHHDKEQRAIIRKMWFSHADGASAARIGKEIIATMNV